MESTSNPPRKRARQSSSTPEQDAGKAQKQLKKRIQNRNSQKCYREKQLSYIRSLEDIVNSVGRGGAGEAGSSENEQKLIKKNRELEDALLRLRKKFMSLSTAAMLGAEDTIFQDILKNARSTPEQIANSPSLEKKESNKDRVSLVAKEEIVDHAVVNRGHHPLEDASVLPYNYLDNSTENVEGLFSILDGFHTMEVPPVFPSPVFPNLTIPQPQYIKRRRFRGISISFDVLGVEDAVRNATSQNPSIELVECTSLAMRVMLKQSPLLEDYFNIMGGMYAITRVIVWRLKPTISNRDAVPMPFTPTILQQHFPQHHHCIDFLPWAELRDQLLLHMGEVDFGQLGMDCLISLVQDIPQLNIALPSLEVCFNLVEYLKNEMDRSGVVSLETALGLNGTARTPGHRRVFDILKAYSLDKVVERKLNPKFAEKYPFLDVSRLITNYPVRSICGEGQKFVGHQNEVGPWPVSTM